MDKFRQQVIHDCEVKELVQPGDRVLVACSGGADSVALLHFFISEKERLGIEVAAIHVDHMLRGNESKEDGTFVEEMCKKNRVKFYGHSIPVPDIIREIGGNVQAVCREERYKVFEDVMNREEWNVLATAHHADDQLETLLMELTRGAVPSGIAAKREFGTGVLVRPFLGVQKVEIFNYLTGQGLAFREDPSNESNKYRRNRIRHSVLPVLKQENEHVSVKSTVVAENLQEDHRFIETIAEEKLKGILQFSEEGLPMFETNDFLAAPSALQRRMIPLLLNYLYHGNKQPVEYKTALLDQISHHLQSSDGTIHIDLPSGYRFIREYSTVRFVSHNQLPSTVHTIELSIGKPVAFLGWNFYWDEADGENPSDGADGKEIRYFSLPESRLPLRVRVRKEGDRIELPGLVGSKKLARLFIDEKVGKTLREQWPILVDSTDVVCAVPGIRYSNLFTTIRMEDSQYILIAEKIKEETRGGTANANAWK